MTCMCCSPLSHGFPESFSEIPAVDILCSFYMKDGKPLECLRVHDPKACTRYEASDGNGIPGDGGS